MNTRIFTWKTLCPTKVKNHDLLPVGFSALHYYGQIGYKVTHLVTSNSHSMSNTFGHTYHVLVSTRLGQYTLTLKRMKFSPYYNASNSSKCKVQWKLWDFAKIWTISITLTKNSIFSLLKLTQISQNLKTDFSYSCTSTTKCFLFLNNFRQKIVFNQEKETSKNKIF